MELLAYLAMRSSKTVYHCGVVRLATADCNSRSCTAIRAYIQQQSMALRRRVPHARIKARTHVHQFSQPSVVQHHGSSMLLSKYLVRDDDDRDLWDRIYLFAKLNASRYIGTDTKRQEIAI